MSGCDVATTIRELVVRADAQAGWTALLGTFPAPVRPAQPAAGRGTRRRTGIVRLVARAYRS